MRCCEVSSEGVRCCDGLSKGLFCNSFSRFCQGEATDITQVELLIAVESLAAVESLVEVALLVAPTGP